MIKDCCQVRRVIVPFVLFLFAGVHGVAASWAQEAAGQAQSEAGLVIQNDPDLPDTYPHASYELRFRARGGVPVLHWRVEKGGLPPGMKLDDDGLLHGQPERSGEFQFTVSVRDGNQPPAAVQKGFTLRVRSALTLSWKKEAHVIGSRIEGSAEVSNTTPDDIDLTFIVLAVPSNGRAVAIGYQHFLLRRGTVEKELPFGESLPHGGYVVHVDAVGEVAVKKLIYRERMQTPSMLQVTVGP
ncbi:MAG TPA: putative Ig domain-containing protein [Candidatus Dormibacteraeota bacterium]|nr:putative Ig domain-containing protein [Candidatus Dormibacteraeota bacterium]